MESPKKLRNKISVNDIADKVITKKESSEIVCPLRSSKLSGEAIYDPSPIRCTGLFLDIQEKYRYSVLQIFCIRAQHNIYRPYLPPDDATVRGTGFIIDIKKGLVVTNAHVVSNEISIRAHNPLLGKQDIQLELLSICREKDVSLLRMIPQDIKLLTDRYMRNTSKQKDIEDLNMKFGDNFKLRQTDEVLAIGYPLGMDSIKFTTGVVSGFQTNVSDNSERDGLLSDGESLPSFIQITAPLNPGNSGGPVLNLEGEVVGIASAGILFSQNVGYAIGSRSVLSVLRRMISREDNIDEQRDIGEDSIPIKSRFTPKNGVLPNFTNPHVLPMPKFSLDYSQTNVDLIEHITGREDVTGVHICRIYPDSVFEKLESGDILSEIIYPDIFFGSKDSFNLKVANPKSADILIKLDNSGEISLTSLSEEGTKNKVILQDGVESERAKLVNFLPKNLSMLRKFSLKEILDTLELGVELQIIFYRNKKKYKLDTVYEYRITEMVERVYPQFQPIDYLIFAGICVSELTMNLADAIPHLEKYVDGKKKYRKYVVINQVFPETMAASLNVLAEFDILKSVNGENITSLDTIRDILKEEPEYLQIQNTDKCVLFLKWENHLSDFEKIYRNFPYLKI